MDASPLPQKPVGLPPKPVSVPGVGSVWEHYKGHQYRVIATSRHSEHPEQWLVTYRPLAGGDDWTRILLAKPNWPDGFLDSFGGGDPRHRFRLCSGPRSWVHEERWDLAVDVSAGGAAIGDVEALADEALKAAHRHGDEAGDPDHETGDLQVMLRAALAVMTPAQRAVWRSQGEVQDVLDYSAT